MNDLELIYKGAHCNYEGTQEVYRIKNTDKGFSAISLTLWENDDHIPWNCEVAPVKFETDDVWHVYGDMDWKFNSMDECLEFIREQVWGDDTG